MLPEESLILGPVVPSGGLRRAKSTKIQGFRLPFPNFSRAKGSRRRISKNFASELTEQTSHRFLPNR